MRPLRLTMTAFGPYAGAESVDFDALAELGLFVVAGPNGAGKTSIFDALFYALYGHLPGRRTTYGRLRSDHAAADVECSVVLDFAAGDGVWRVERAPKQRRPKRRGAGDTEVRARAVLYRLDEQGEATAVANRIDEVNERCRELVGLSGRQFERVALLPQGEFSRVLRESGAERRELLRTLFASEVFDRAKVLLNERSEAALETHRSRRERLAAEQQRIADEFERLSGLAVDPGADAVSAAIDTYERHEIDSLARRVEALAAAAAQADRVLAQARATAQAIARRTALQRELDAHVDGQADHDDRELRLARARAAIPVCDAERARRQAADRHDTAERSVAELRARLDGARSELGIADSTTTVADELAELATTHEQLARQQGELDEVAALLSAAAGRRRRQVATIAALHDEQRGHARRLERFDERIAAAPGASALESLRADARSATGRLTERRRLDELDLRRQELMTRRATTAQRVEQAGLGHDRAVAASADADRLARAERAATDTLAEIERRRDARHEFERLIVGLDNARAASDRAHAEAQQLLDRFVRGSAAMLAADLTDDTPCPVCGSCDHPAPADTDAPTETVQIDQVNQAQDVATAAQRELADLVAAVARLTEAFPSLGDDSVESLDEAVGEATRAALTARDAAESNRAVAAGLASAGKQLAECRAELAQLDQQLESLSDELAELTRSLGADAARALPDVELADEQARQALADAERSVTELEQLAVDRAAVDELLQSVGLRVLQADRNLDLIEDELDRLGGRRTELVSALGSMADVDHREYLARVRATQALLPEVDTAAAVELEAADAVRRASLLVDRRRHESMFDDIDQALAAQLDQQALHALDQTTRAWTERHDLLRGQLSELADHPVLVPDLDALTGTADRAGADHAEANRQLIENTAAVRSLRDSLERVSVELAEIESADDSERGLHRVAALVRGDNDRNTSLENWVLAAHLREVVELANVRLARSTGGRFQLTVLDDGEHRRGTWGLELAVEDTVTGTSRPTAGLSGGELFQASLALALGLADVVMANASGVRIDTLFIDEGFGSLDHASVDRVIDLLDDLRGQGATVGLITHVAALLQALPCGIEVDPSPGGGSVIRQRSLAA